MERCGGQHHDKAVRKSLVHFTVLRQAFADWYFVMGFSGFFYVGWLIDGGGGEIQERVLITVDGGIITEVKQCENLKVPESAIDLSHCTIMPPFVDSHVHLWMSGTTNLKERKQQLTAHFEQLQPVISQHQKILLAHGVLAIREGGHRNGASLRYRDELHGSCDSPLITRITGRAWHRKGRYGALIGRAPEDNVTLASAFLQDPEKGDHVKLVNSGLNSLKEYGRETEPQFTLEEISQFVTEAAKKKMKVMVHANGKEPVRLAIEAGCHSIEHGYFMGTNNLKLMAEKKVVLVPTLYTMKAYAEHMSPEMSGDRDIAEKNYLHQIQQLREARELGVTVALGTDAGSMGVLHGESVAEELKLFIKAGYSLSEAIKCATFNGAELLDIDSIGLLKEKKPASFIVARGTPSQLPRKLSYLEAMYLDGLPCSGYRKKP